MEYKFSGELNFDDYVQFQKVALKGLWLTRKMIIVFCLLIAIFTSDLLDFRKGIYLKDAPTIIAIVAFSIFIIVFLITFNSKRIYKKSFDENKIGKERCDFTINEDKITIVSESGSSILTRDNIHKISFDKDTIYIFMAKNIARIIKKRFVENEEKYNELVLFIKDKYKDNVKKN
jgi:hypothetical protein